MRRIGDMQVHPARVSMLGTASQNGPFSRTIDRLSMAAMPTQTR